MAKKTRSQKSKPLALRSKLELRCKEQLDAGAIKYGYEDRTLRFDTTIRGGFCRDCKGKHVAQSRRYLADFTIGPSTILEVKGYLNSPQRTKILGIRASNPDIDFRLYFGADNKIAKGSETRYSDWCKQHTIPYCIRTIPEEWLKEWRTL